MRKRVFILLLLLALVLSACGGQETIHLVEYDNHLLTLDTANQTFTDGATVYRYEIDDRGSGTGYTIVYPDGATYSMTQSGAIGTGGGDSLYYAADRLEGSGLIDLVMKYHNDSRSGPVNTRRFPLCLLCIAFGVFNVAAPYASWFIGCGWRYENAEPSALYLAVLRIGGIVMIAAGVVLLFI